MFGDVLFQTYKINEIVNKLLLAGNKFMSEMHLMQHGFSYSTFGPFTKNKESVQNLKWQVIQDIFTKRNYIKPAFNMILWYRELWKFT